jgi:hypothetical protein
VGSSWSAVGVGKVSNRSYKSGWVRESLTSVASNRNGLLVSVLLKKVRYPGLKFDSLNNRDPGC